MKTTGFSILLIWFAIFAYAANTFAQDSPQSHLPEGATARLGKGWITEIAYSPDGTRLAVAGSIGIWLYDAQTGEALDLLTGHTSMGHQRVVFTRWQHARKCKLGQDRASVGCEHRQSPPHAHGAYGFGSAACRFHPMATRSQVEVGTGPCVCGMRPPAVPSAPSQGIRVWVSSVSFSPDGNTLASGSRTRPCVCGMRPPAVPSAPSQGIRILVSSVSFSPDGNTLASASLDNTVRLWDATTGSPLRTLTGHTDLRS